MKKLSLLLSILFIAAGLTASSQTVSKEKLAGTWKVTGMIIEDVRMSFENKDSLRMAMYESSLEEEPGKVFTAEDSTQMEFAVELIYGIFSNMEMAFQTNGKYTMKVVLNLKGVKKKEDATGTYKLKGNKLTLDNSEKKEDKNLGVSMPDDNTLLVTGFGNSGGELVFVRQ